MVLSNILKFIGPPILFFIMGWVINGWRVDSEYKAQYNEQVAQLKAQEDNMNTVDKSYNSNKNNYINEIFKFKEDTNANPKNPTDNVCTISINGVRYLNTIVNKTNNTIALN